MKAQKHNLFEVENLCSKIISIKDTGRTEGISEQLNQLCKLLIWGDRHDTDFFEHFFEIKALDKLLQIFGKTSSKEVVIAIISFFSNLLSNLSRSENVTYLLSHPCLISLQNIKFVSLDNQIAEYYINFLNTVAQKVDASSLHIFFNRRYPSFPLIMQTARFYNHPESLVRTKCRSILLTCLKLNNNKVRKFASGFPFVTYYIHECNLLKQYWHIVDNIQQLQGDKQFELSQLEGILEDQKQLIMIIDDFMKIDPLNIPKCIINAFANECMAPLLQALFSHEKVTFNLRVVLLVASMLITNVRNQEFLDFVVFSLFGRYYTSKICIKLLHPVEKPLSYSKKWKFKGFWDSYQNNVNEYCTETYFPDEKSIVSDIYLQEQAKKPAQTQKKYTNQVKSIFGMGTNFYDREVEKIQQIFGIPINSAAQNFQRKALSELLSEFKQSIRTESINIDQMQQNPVRQPLLSFLKSKDDSFVILALHLLNNVVNNKNISPEILQFCALSTKPKNYDFKSVVDLQQIIKCCYSILQVEPPAFRICTYKQAETLVDKCLEIYNGEQDRVPKEVLLMAKMALRRSVERLAPHIYTGNDWQKSLDIFNKVSVENTKARRKDLYSYGLLERQQGQINSLQHHKVYDIFPKTDEQIRARDFWLYIINRDSYCRLTQLSLKHEVTNCDQKSEQNAQSFERQTQYDIPPEHQIQVSYKQPQDKLYSSCSLIFLGGYLVVGVKKVVKFKSTYQDCIMLMDRSDASKILLQINSTVLSVQTESAKKSYDIRKHFQQMKTLTFKYQLSQLVKQTEWMLEQSKTKINS